MKPCNDASQCAIAGLQHLEQVFRVEAGAAIIGIT